METLRSRSRRSRRNYRCSSTLWITLTIGIFLFAFGCASNPYNKTNRLYKANVRAMNRVLAELPEKPYQVLPGAPEALSEWVGSYHFNLRRPNYLIIHHTAQNSLEQTLRTFTVPHSQVSSHYVIGRDGTVVQMLNDYLRGWHAGVGKWGSLTDLNSASIGIELDNNGREPFSDRQISSLLVLLDTLKTRHRIPTPNFLAHSDIAPTRKADPSALFPWEILAAHGFGLWPVEPEELVNPPEHFNAMDALRIIGYDTSNPGAAIVAFKRRYIQDDLMPQLTVRDLRVLYSIYAQIK